MSDGFSVDELIDRPVEMGDGERLGTVQRVAAGADGQRYLVVTSSLFGTGEYFVPEVEIERATPDRVVLKITRDDLRELDWLAAPDDLPPS